MARDRTKIIRLGASDLIIGTVEKTGAGETYDLTTNGFPLYDLGHLEDEKATIKTSGLSMKELGGHQFQVAHDVELAASGLQLDVNEIAELENIFKATQQSVFLIGSQESHELGRTAVEIIPDLILDAKGKRLCSVQARSYMDQIGVVNTARLAIGIDTSAETRAPYRYRTFINARTRRANLQLSLLPDVGNFGNAAKLLDESLNRYVGTLFNTPTWSFPYLRFDGVNQYADFGDILDDDGVSDFMIEAWVRTQAADGTTQVIFGKKNLYTDNTAGFAIFRYGTTNKIICKFSDGTSSINPGPGASTMLQNAWRYIAVAVDRNGDATVYQDGVAGTPVSIAALGSMAHDFTLKVGRVGSNYGQSDVGRIRIYNFGAGGLPANVASMIANHYNAEKAVYGL